MFENLRAYMERGLQLTDEQFDFIKTLFIPKKMKKGEFHQREGEITKYVAFVVKGCLRSYTIDAKGKEHIVLFAPENWWIGDLNSAMNQVPSVYFIDAIENSDVLISDYLSQKKMMESIPEIAAEYRTGLQKRTAAMDKRILASLSASAGERYLNFLETYPSIAQRVPQHMLASYLGISPETLSRIRKQRVKKK